VNTAHVSIEVPLKYEQLRPSGAVVTTSYPAQKVPTFGTGG